MCLEYSSGKENHGVDGPGRVIPRPVYAGHSGFYGQFVAPVALTEPFAGVYTMVYEGLLGVSLSQGPMVWLLITVDVVRFDRSAGYAPASAL